MYQVRRKGQDSKTDNVSFYDLGVTGYELMYQVSETQSIPMDSYNAASSDWQLPLATVGKQPKVL